MVKGNDSRDILHGMQLLESRYLIGAGSAALLRAMACYNTIHGCDIASKPVTVYHSANIKCIIIYPYE